MTRYIVTVEFLVEAEAKENWTAKQCAYDYVLHVIDEGALQND